MRQRLESIFGSGDNLFRLVSKHTEDGDQLELLVDQYSDLHGVYGIKVSAQPDMSFPPESIDHIQINSFGNELILTINEEETSAIKGSIEVFANDEWVCFYLNIDYKLIIHVQPVTASYNFRDYEHKQMPKANIEKELADLEASGKRFNDKLAEMMEEIDKINEDMLKMEMPK